MRKYIFTTISFSTTSRYDPRFLVWLSGFIIVLVIIFLNKCYIHFPHIFHPSLIYSHLHHNKCVSFPATRTYSVPLLAMLRHYTLSSLAFTLTLTLVYQWFCVYP